MCVSQVGMGREARAYLPLLNVSLLSLFFSFLWPFFLLVENIVFVFFCWLMAFDLETICEGSVRGAGRSKNAPADLLEDINKPLS